MQAPTVRSQQSILQIDVPQEPPTSACDGMEEARVPIAVSYVKTAEADKVLKAPPGHVMAEVYYGRYLPFEVTAPGQTIHLDLPQLEEPALTEVWTSPLPVTYLAEEGMGLALNGQLLFGYLEARVDRSMDILAYRTYRRLLTRAQSFGYPHLLRIWNFFPRINLENKGLERYQQFCVGRHQALAEGYPNFPRSLPAATAMGTRSGPLQVYFLATTCPPLHIENPRQVSAYHYPRMYGPRSPSFARATLASVGSGRHLFIAGTASIVGHASRHPRDPRKQTLETLNNIEQVINEVRSLPAPEAALDHSLQADGDSTLLKAYLRRPEHLPTIKRALEEHLGPEPCCLYLEGRMCRPALLLEIEGILAHR